MENKFYPVTVTHKRIVAQGITAFRVSNDAPLANSVPGAHIDVRLPSGLERQYSLTQAEGEAPMYYEFAVLRENDGRGGSRELVDKVQLGDKLEISAPRCNFELDTSHTNYLIIGAGVGVTPLLGMARTLNDLQCRFAFHICAKTSEHVPFKRKLDDSPFNGRIRYHFSQDESSFKLHLPSFFSAVSKSTQIYACGPEAFLTQLKQVTADWPSGGLRVEHFKNEVEAISEELSGDFKLELRKTGTQLIVPPSKSILEVLTDAGIDMPSSCEEGVCGTCVTKVIDGEIIHRDACLYEEEKEANSAIACCVSRGHPGSTIVLDL